MKISKIVQIAVVSLFLFACRGEVKIERPNTNAIWLWGTHMMEAPVAEWAEKGYGHILLNEAAFNQWGEDTVYAFIDNCEKLGMTVHVWFQAFYEKGKWICPVDDETQQIKQDYYDRVVARAVDYAKKGVAGIHLDYIRYGGTAYKHDYPGCRATWQITEFCKQLNEAVKPVNPNIILSAALMPEINSEYYYGQNPMQMGKYLDVLMPMVYRYGYAGEDKPLSWVEEVCNWFVANSGGAQVWAGIQTYTLDLTRTNEHPIEMCADSILADCKDIVNTNAHGIVLFRHGLGEFPDVHGLWDNKPLPAPAACGNKCSSGCGEKKSCEKKACGKQDGECGKKEGCGKKESCGSKCDEKKACEKKAGECGKHEGCKKQGGCQGKENCDKQACGEKSCGNSCDDKKECRSKCGDNKQCTKKEGNCDKHQTCGKQDGCHSKQACGENSCGNENCNKEGALGYVTGSAKSVPVKEFAIAITMYNTILVDVRTEKEHNAGYIPGTHFNLNVLDEDFEQKALSTLCKCKNIAIYCRSGNRSKKAMEILYKNGYNVIELATGANGWAEAEKELVKK